MIQEETLLALLRDADRKLDRKRRGFAVKGHTHEDLRQTLAQKCLEYKQRNGVLPPSSAYIVKMGLNVRASLARKRSPQELPEERLDNNLSREPDPAETTLQAEERSLLDSALASLRFQDKEIIRLHLFEERSHESIARDLGQTTDAIRSRYFRAVARLRARMCHFR